MRGDIKEKQKIQKRDAQQSELSFSDAVICSKVKDR